MINVMPLQEIMSYYNVISYMIKGFQEKQKKN